MSVTPSEPRRSVIHDLGYRPYEGVRLPPSHNTWVMLRQGLKVPKDAGAAQV